MADSLHFPSPEPNRLGLGGLPCAHVDLAQSADGRWMWGVSFCTNYGGEGCAPLEKWGKFAPTREAAIAAGIDELRERLSRRSFASSPQAKRLFEWMESITSPQLELFE